MSKRTCEVLKLGIVDYQAAWDLQNRIADEIARGDRPATLLLLEHPHTYTFGRRGQAGNLLWDPSELFNRGIEVHWTDRGGDVTYHGPGQLVGYPLLPLGRPAHRGINMPFGQNKRTTDTYNRIPKADYVGYIRRLEQVLIKVVAEFGVEAKQVGGLTGVWFDGAQRSEGEVSNHPTSIQKLASIGIKVDARGISRHGFALNVNPDMGYWEGIIGCGLPYPEVSLAGLLNHVPDMEAVMNAVVDSFGNLFEFEISDAK
jgi:lipoyl(octanoyl) transferase